MPQITLKIETKRPLDCTPEKLLAMRELGMSLGDIHKVYPQVTVGRLSQLILKAKRAKQEAGG